MDEHHTSSFSFNGNGSNIGDASFGDAFDALDIFSGLVYTDINFTKDTNFTTRSSGIILSALSVTGISNLTSLLQYRYNQFLLSKLL